MKPMGTVTSHSIGSASISVMTGGFAHKSAYYDKRTGSSLVSPHVASL